MNPRVGYDDRPVRPGSIGDVEEVSRVEAMRRLLRPPKKPTPWWARLLFTLGLKEASS